jgi:hypothetical protein
VAELLAGFADGPPMRALGIDALPHGEACETLGAAPLVALARRLRAAAGRLLLVAGDPDGGAAAAIVDPAC